MQTASSRPDPRSGPAGVRHLRFEPALQVRGVGDDLRERLPVSVTNLLHDFGLVGAVGLGQVEPGNAGIFVMQGMVAEVMPNEGIVRTSSNPSASSLRSRGSDLRLRPSSVSVKKMKV